MGFKAAISSLTMVGTVHRDPKGFSKLSRLLENERPDLISVEISPYARALRARRSAGFRATLRENLRRISKEEIRLPPSLLLAISHGGERTRSLHGREDS